MVYAITEIVRVLVPGGRLIDVRPVGTKFDVELCDSGCFTLLGQFARSDEKVRSDEQCDSAIQYAVRKGWLKQESTASITSYYYGDDPSEDIGPVEIPESECARIRKLQQQPNTRLRARYQSSLTIYRREPSPYPASLRKDQNAVVSKVPLCALDVLPNSFS